MRRGWSLGHLPFLSRWRLARAKQASASATFRANIRTGWTSRSRGGACPFPPSMRTTLGPIRTASSRPVFSGASAYRISDPCRSRRRKVRSSKACATGPSFPSPTFFRSTLSSDEGRVRQVSTTTSICGPRTSNIPSRLSIWSGLPHRRRLSTTFSSAAIETGRSRPSFPAILKEAPRFQAVLNS